MLAEGRVIEQHKRKFMEFLGADEYEGKYHEKIRQTINDRRYRVMVNINELRSRESDLVPKIMRRPREYIVALQEAAIDTAKSLDPSFEKVLHSKEIHVGFEGSFGMNSVTPRGLNSQLLNSLVEVEGIVVKCSNVRPKLVRSVQFCPATKEYSLREYRDATSIDIGIEVRENGGERLPTTSTFPNQDNAGNPLEVEPGYCTYKNYQTVVLQEMPEKSKVGQLPRSIEVILEHDLVDRVKPGDRVLCVGVYRSLPSSVNGQTNGVFRSVIICNNISILGKEVGAVRLTANDIKNIKEFSQRRDALEVMSRSLCPTIFGHEFIKKAIILQLLGGVERNLDNGTHLRGDINLMMVGDPSTAKSQLLRAVLEIAPLAISTTGRGSSGVGLTAAVTFDSETGEKRLEAGAMVLADRGVVCIDEFDKMSENDRVAIHEVMEQQTVTIAKAGIHAALNARCSVIAAANPIYGQYDKSRRPTENIGLPDSLLSRFDLLFIVLDQLDPTFDKRLSHHVIRSHQFRRPGTIMEPDPLNSTTQHFNLDDNTYNGQPVDTPVWQRSGNGSSAASTDNEEEEEVDLLTKDFLRKYIHYSKSRIHPVLSEEAMERISSDYANMRAQQSRRNLPITARTLETMIRLATASAKSRLSQSVDIVDVDAAAELLNFVLFHEIGSSVAAAAPAVPTTTSTTPESSNQQSNQITTNSTEGEEEETASEESMSDLLISLCAGLAKMHNDSFEVSLLVSEFKRKHPQIKSDAIIQETIQQLEAANRIMVAEDMIFMV
jgi:DNA replication licensing factor MCM3